MSGSSRVKISTPETTIEIEITSDKESQYPAADMDRAAIKAQELYKQITDKPSGD